MVNLSDEQVDFILREVQARGVTLEDLQWNLVDHMCCIIENEMSDTDDFNLFFERLLPRFFNDNLREIQEETELLLTFKHFYAMKKTLIYAGLTASFFTLVGSFLKVMHWPGAAISLVLGIGIFCLLFLPLMIVLKFRDETTRTDKLVQAFGLITGMSASIGFLFKIQHWPFANMLMISGLVAFTFVFVPLYFATRVRRPELRFNTIINSILMLASGGLLFAMLNLNKSKVEEASQLHYKALLEEVQKLETPVEVTLDSTTQVQWTNELSDVYSSIGKLKIAILRRSGTIPAREMETLKEWEAFDYMKSDQLVKQVFNAELMTKWAQIKADLRAINSIIESKFPKHANMQFNVDEMELLNATTKVGVEQLTLIQLHLQLLKSKIK